MSLNVADRDTTTAWYGDVLGLVPSDSAAAPPEEPVFLGEGGAQVALFADRPAPGLRHVALATDAAGFAAVRANLDRAGHPYRFERHTHHDSLYCADPDGATIEVMDASGD